MHPMDEMVCKYTDTESTPLSRQECCMCPVQERGGCASRADRDAVCAPEVRVEERDWLHRCADGDAVCPLMMSFQV